MNKSELIDSIADKSGLNKTQAGDALNAVMESVGEALEAGDSISLVGFGTFSVKDRKARTGRNPKTGEELSIPASKVPSFSNVPLSDEFNAKLRLYARSAPRRSPSLFFAQPICPSNSACQSENEASLRNDL